MHRAGTAALQAKAKTLTPNIGTWMASRGGRLRGRPLSFFAKQVGLVIKDTLDGWRTPLVSCSKSASFSFANRDGGGHAGARDVAIYLTPLLVIGTHPVTALVRFLCADG